AWAGRLARDAERGTPDVAGQAAGADCRASLTARGARRAKRRTGLAGRIGGGSGRRALSAGRDAGAAELTAVGAGRRPGCAMSAWAKSEAGGPAGDAAEAARRALQPAGGRQLAERGRAWAGRLTGNAERGTPQVVGQAAGADRSRRLTARRAGGANSHAVFAA